MGEEKLIRWLLGGELDDFSLETMAMRARIKRLSLEEAEDISEARKILIPPGEPWDVDGFRGISIDTYRKLGAIKCDRGFYANRIVFPIYLKGELIGVDARALGDQKPKYIRNKGSSCSENWLFPFDVVAEMNPSYVILAEGAFDAINSYDKGFPALSIFGCHNWSMSKLRMVLNLGVKEVILGTDNDLAGKKAEQEIGAMLQEWIPTYSLDTSKFGEGRDLGDLTRDEIQYAVDHKVRFKKSM